MTYIIREAKNRDDLKIIATMLKVSTPPTYYLLNYEKLSDSISNRSMKII